MITPTWFYSDGQQTYGPVNRDQLITMIQSGQLVPEHFIMTQGTEEWQLIRSSPFAGYLPRTAAAASAVAPQAQHPAPQTAANTTGAPKRPAPPPKHAAGMPPPKKAPVAQAPAAQTGLPSWVVITAVLVVLATGWWLTRPAPIQERKTTKRLEGEALKVLQVTGGEVETQPMKQTNALWSGDAHLWWHDGAANYYLDLEFNVEPEQAGKQRLKAAFTSSWDYGIVEVSVDGRKLRGKVFDLQSNGAVISGARDLGLHDLAEGPHVLRIGILDTSVINMDKREAFKVGLDYLQLEPPVSGDAPAAAGTNIASKAQPSASFCSPYSHVHVRHLNTSQENVGRKSSDEGLPLQAWHPHRGSAEWVQYEWDSPQAIGECRVFWYDDSAVRGGGCALPAFWRLLYREESTGAWVPVDAAIPAAERDTWNSVKFMPVKTTALRIAVQCLDGYSAGICHWQALAADPATVPDAKPRERPDLFLGDLSPMRAQTHWSPYWINTLTANARNDNRCIMVGRMPCSQFLFAHAQSRLDFAIPSGYTRFTTFGVGVSDVRNGDVMYYGNWKHRVLVDGKVLAESNELSTYKDREFAVDVTFPAGAKVLTLINDPLGNPNSDHAHWAYPTLLTADSQKMPNTPTATVAWSSMAAPPLQTSSAPPSPATLPASLISTGTAAAGTAPASLDLGPVGHTIFPHVQFSGASLEEAAEFFRIKSRDLDPQHKGLGVLTQNTSGITPTSISIDLENITLSDALRFVAMLAHVEITRVGDAVTLTPSATVHPPYPASQPSARVQRHNAVRFPQIQFSKASLPEAAEFLRVKTRDLDPQHERAHLIIDPELDSNAVQISLDLKDVPFSEALKYVCALTKVEAVCVGDAYYIQPKK